MTPFLTHVNKTDAPRINLGNRQAWTLGRSTDNEIVLNDQWASREHAMIQKMDDGALFLIDRGSRNGSFVNGRRVSTPVKLDHEDELAFGETVLKLHLPQDQPPDQNPPGEGQDSQPGIKTIPMRQRKMITVLVVDIRDFTVLTQNVSEELLSEVIGAFFGKAGQIIRKHGSWVDKYIGDSLMAVWFHHDDANQARDVAQVLRALWDINEMTAQISQAHPLPFPLRIGAGVNTGFAMVGNTGDGDRPDYTALGDTVNTAFRLETATKDIGADLIIGEATWRVIEAQAKALHIFTAKEVTAKGYDQPMSVHAAAFESLRPLIAEGAAATWESVTGGGEELGSGG